MAAMRTLKLHRFFLLTICALHQSAADGDIDCYDLDGSIVDDVPCRPDDIRSQPYCCGFDQDCMASSLCRNKPGTDDAFLFERPTLAGEDWLESGGLKLCPEIDIFPAPVVVCNGTSDDGGLLFACVREDQDADEACAGEDTFGIMGNDGEAFSIDQVVDERSTTSSFEESTTSSFSDTSSTAEAVSTTETTSNTPASEPRETETHGRIKEENEDSDDDDPNEDDDEGDDTPSESNNKTVIIVGASLGAFGGICLILLGLIGCRWLKKRRSKELPEYSNAGDQPPAKLSSSNVSGTAELAGSSQYEAGAAHGGAPDPRFSKMERFATPQSCNTAARVSTLSVAHSESPMTPIDRTVSPMLTPLQEMATPFNEAANFRIERKAVPEP